MLYIVSKMKMKYIPFIAMFISLNGFAQKPITKLDSFWTALQQHCGKSYEGVIISGATADFKDKKLVMHVKACEENRIRIPFNVSDNRSRTWVLTKKKSSITLKHDHRQEDGSEDTVTQYGGTSTNEGFSNMQIFPADLQTQKTIPAAASNVWWITINDSSFTYNLRRIGSDRLFTVSFNVKQPIETPLAP
ncbi:MAG: hypothetical protein ACK41Z_10465 [Sediminibacterium sp.]